MKKNAFTLVELLAVIAILAILIIIALPNILKMFNNAKSDVFVTEVKTVTSTAEKKFLDSQISGENETTFCRCETDSLNPLNMSGAEKNYYVKLNNSGRVKYVVVWDEEKYIKYKYTSNNSITSLDRTDIVKNDNFGITCENVVDELNLNAPTPIGDMTLSAVLKGKFYDDMLNIDIKLLDSEDLENEITYRIYQMDYDIDEYVLIDEADMYNNENEFYYRLTTPNNVCSHRYKIEAYYNGNKIKEKIIESQWGCAT
ncbi:MAG: prepilin-type N-terminal cleavage/methylation domain-containing protein [Tenericutes bacterium]|nr:prepilin-type N-terminal cleavage/methylation domain-containing protein [Mycoplasmatota bacterium]